MFDMKRLVIVLSTYINVAQCIAATATIDGITWTYSVSSGKASVGLGSSSAISTTTKGEISVPSTLGGKPVTSISSFAFSGCSALTGITIPNSVTSIGDSAFFGCSALKKMSLPFVGARRGNSGSSDSVFGYIFGSTSYSGGVKTYQTYSYNENHNPQYSDKCYYVPASLQDIVLSDETVIGFGAFNGCKGLTHVAIPTSVTSIGDYAFSGCRGLTSITIPDGVTNVLDHAFYQCSGLTSVTIPDGVISIGKYAFCGCSELKEVRIPSSVKGIEYYAFGACDKIEDVHISDITAWCGISFGKSGWGYVPYDSEGANPLRYAQNLYINGVITHDLIIPDGVTQIGDCAFLNVTV